MGSVKTSKGHHASLVGIALAMMLTGAALWAQQAQQQAQALPAARQGSRPQAVESGTPQAPGEAETLHVLIGRPLVVSSPARIKRISVADPGIIDAVPMNSNQVLINGKAAGGVSLVLWDETGLSQEFYVHVDVDARGVADQVRPVLPNQPVRAEVHKKMAWLGWVVIASVALLAGAIIGVSQRPRNSLNKLDLHAQKGTLLEGYNEPELAVAPHQARAQRDPEEETITEGLPALKTHGYFREAVDGEWRRSIRAGRQFSLLIMGLDKFTQINERMGRLEGDRLLTAVATLLEARSRERNVVARYGADEFAILAPETNAQQAEILAEGLRAAVEADHFLRTHQVTVSFGIATFPDHGRTPEEILGVANSGRDLAKRCAGNCVKLASPNPKPGNAERNERLLEAYLEAAVKGSYSAAPDAFCHYQIEFERMKTLWDTITALAFAVEAKGPCMKGHSRAVSRLAAGIATELGLSQAEVEEIRLAGIVHDIGKLDVPEDMLEKPTLLTAEEFEIVKSHAARGAKILEPLNMKGIERIVRHHHERYDGKGYPDGLAGDRIPLGARIVAVAESFHNMVSDLPYERARTFEDALAELRRCSGTQFDPKVVTAFLDWVNIHDESHKQQRQQDAAVFSEPQGILQPA